MSKIEELEKQLTELDERKVALQHELELEKQKTKIEYPFEEKEVYLGLAIDGDLICDRWASCKYDKDCFELGNAFKTKQEAIKERDKRILLTRFRQFRDKCNGDWKPDFKDDKSWKHHLAFNHTMSVMTIYSRCNIDEFHLFGYFKKEADARRALELFGDAIKRLFVEVTE